MACLSLSPSSFSISSSTGRPWQSQPPLRSTRGRREVRAKVLEARASRVNAGLAVGGGRPLVEDERLGPDPLVDRALEHLPVAPQLEHAGVEREEVEVGVDLGELAHPVIVSFASSCSTGEGTRPGPRGTTPRAGGLTYPATHRPPGAAGQSPAVTG